MSARIPTSTTVSKIFNGKPKWERYDYDLVRPVHHTDALVADLLGEKYLVCDYNEEITVNSCPLKF